MLAARDLDGPTQRLGVRASPNAPRVSISSVEAWESRRADRRTARSSGRATVTEAGLKDDAYRLKIALDLARDQITRQRQQNERLAALLAETVVALQQEQALAREADGIAEQYATIATNHLAPDTMAGE